MKHSVPYGLVTLLTGALALAGGGLAWGDATVEKRENAGPAPATSAPANRQGSSATAGRKARTAEEAELVIAELELALQAADLRCKELEELLGRKQESNTPLETALAVANADAEAFRERYRDLRLSVESWGVETLGSDKALRERLIVAVREREQAMKRHARALEQLLALSESIVDYLKTPEAKSRLRVEEQLRKADETFGFGSRRGPEPEPKPLDEGRVVSLKEEYRLAVLDVGKRSGVCLGLPMDLYRKDRLVGSGVVVDVRDQICGVVVQKVFKEGDQIRVSDRGEPHASTTIQF